MKARDLIPGWPRGRSTSGVMRLSLARKLVLWAEYGDIVDDPRLREDIEAELTEERRKSEMMEAWDAMERRMRESSILYAKPPGERAIAAMAALLDLVERTK